MPRWEHGSEDRLKQAAMELFDEQGFEDTSAVQIADRARVTTRTFFRYFPDKQEILFADAELLYAALVRQVAETADVAEPLRAVTRTLAGFDWEGLGSRDVQRRRDALIASNPALLERELIKQQRMADGFADALHRRGADPAVAELAAQVGIQVFRTAYREWLEAGDDAGLATITEAAMSRLAAMMPAAYQATTP
ncbi:TetR family transcriptional regulator [Actinoplanes sp. NBRC 103695]|uniref:TetR family transcriptional regulator n=1 Tax=Actinoplanes sp. NBRC 103695 TaxID=3032202 RepID=UPI0024A1D83C|nr:TetR family transcriptional regulator [Actinoplanes sp. NBRC 103695]GLZ00136.1 TetR family transcriptional regulator [Actinoplanes sp. NBRC 103695]